MGNFRSVYLFLLGINDEVIADRYSDISREDI
jgi:hypothetical protein